MRGSVDIVASAELAKLTRIMLDIKVHMVEVEIRATKVGITTCTHSRPDKSR